MRRFVSFCCIPNSNSMSLGRTPQPRRTEGSHVVVVFTWPRGVLNPPHSPFAAVLVRVQSGEPFPLVSLHSRKPLLTLVFSGLLAVAVAVDSLETYRPQLARTTLRPLPDRSHETPTRGSMSFQLGALLRAG